jgi:hypothetical protein
MADMDFFFRHARFAHLFVCLLTGHAFSPIKKPPRFGWLQILKNLNCYCGLLNEFQRFTYEFWVYNKSRGSAGRAPIKPGFGLIWVEKPSPAPLLHRVSK